MHIKYVINQHHCDKTKDYPHVDHWIKEHLYFQYIKTCLCIFLIYFVTRSRSCLLYLVGIRQPKKFS
jgi:hypothetical protein